MTGRPNSFRDYAVFAVSLGLAAVFFYAGFDKVRDPLQFAEASLLSRSCQRRSLTCSR